MFAPEPPDMVQLARITPSIYEAGLTCLAKAAWYALGGHGVLPDNPAAILGTSFHEVVAAAHRGTLMAANHSDRTPARQLFDETVRTLHKNAHPLVKLKFPIPERLPYYNLQRERTSIIAAHIAVSRLSTGSPVETLRTSTSPARTESRLRSKDGLIVGRADHIDGKSESVVDYKSGYVVGADADAVSDSEARQLRLYAYLAGENGIYVSKGIVVRGSGQRCELPISPAEAEAEANSARTQLQTIDAAVTNGAVFSDLASPSPQSCKSCVCIPFCTSFWAAVKPEWSPDCGSHVEGNVIDVESRLIQGVSLTTLSLAVRSGTISGQTASVEQIPSDWMKIEDDLPCSGDVVRVVHGRELEMNGNTAVVRIDKAMIAVWRLRVDTSRGDE
jgi:hypothetical protein